MFHFVKTGFWEKAYRGYKGWLNLEELIRSVTGSSPEAFALEDAATIDIDSSNTTLSSSSATREFTVSHGATDSTMVVTLDNTAATYTFPPTALCVSEGVASGDNILSLSGVAGDKYVIGIKQIGAAYYVVAKNFGQ
jgi:hypothetical protein